MNVAIVCRACGQQGDTPIERLASDLACACGSDDLDLDLSTEASWESDMPMDTLRDTQAITQTARCAFCLNEWQVTVTDPAQPLPACPTCGSTAVSAAGATTTYATATLGSPNITTNAGALSEGGIFTTLINMINYARNSGDDKIPGWFMKFFKGHLLPEEIATGRWVSGAGGSYAWGTMGSKEAAPYKGPPKMPKTPVTPGAGKGEDPEAARKAEERKQRRIEKERQWNAEGDERARKLIPDHFKSSLDPASAKVLEVVEGIAATNPGMSRREAAKLAEEVVARYPKMVRRTS